MLVYLCIYKNVLEACLSTQMWALVLGLWDLRPFFVSSPDVGLPLWRRTFPLPLPFHFAVCLKLLCSFFLQAACAYVCLIINGRVFGGDRGKEEWRCESNWDASLARRLSLVPLSVFKGVELFRPFFLLIHLTFIYWVILCAKHFLGTRDLALNKANFLLSWNLHSIRQLKN